MLPPIAKLILTHRCPLRQVDLAVALVTLLSAEGGVNPNVHAIFAPDSTGKLTLSTDLVSNINNYNHLA